MWNPTGSGARRRAGARHRCRPAGGPRVPVIQLPPGYRVEKVVDKLSYATSLTWDDRGRM